MKVCVLQPDYSTSTVDYKNYDPPRDLSALMPEAEVDHVFLNKLSTYRQLKELKKNNYDIFVSLCEGYLEWDVPSIDVIHSLELLNLPYTGTDARLYDPPKELMKYVAFTQGIKTPAYVLIKNINDIEASDLKIRFPLFVKPAKAGDSLGIDENSLVHTKEKLLQKAAALLPEYDELIVEEYINGREFTVMIAEDAGSENQYKVYKPIEFIFPPGKQFKTYALKTSELHPECNVPVTDAALDQQLRKAAQQIFKGFEGIGYARIDFRMNEKGELFFLEINFTCSVFYCRGYEGSADYILKFDGAGQEGFLRHIIAEGIARHQKKQKKYFVKGNAIAGYGIYTNRDLIAGELIFKGEERAQRIVSKKYVQENWTVEDQEVFRMYAYPLSEDLYVLWDQNPAEWAPQNHSCQPNTAYNGLNVYAIAPIKKGGELTLDYANFMTEEMEAFICNCGVTACRQFIHGRKNNSVTVRESKPQTYMKRFF